MVRGFRLPCHSMPVPAPGSHRASAVELLVIEGDVVVHVALAMVSEDLIPTKTLQSREQGFNTEPYYSQPYINRLRNYTLLIHDYFDLNHDQFHC